MFNINNISDKYSSLYLNDDIKDKFFSLLLIGLDNKYMDVDAETLNNTTQHYKDKLNIRFKEVFNKNFNLKSKDHIGFLSDTLGVNFTFKNLNTNKNRNTFKVYNKTLYFLNDGNEYGLVLKNNKKSLQGGLAESSLKAFEKLNLEGGMMEDNTQFSQQPQTPPPLGSPTPSATSHVTATTGKGESQSPSSSPQLSPLSLSSAASPPASPSSSPEQSQLPSQDKSQSREQSQLSSQDNNNTNNDDYIANNYGYNANNESNKNSLYDGKSDEWKNLCLENCLVNEKSAYYTDIILTEINKEIEQDINDWDEIYKKYPNYRGTISDFIFDYIEYLSFKKLYGENEIDNTNIIAYAADNKYNKEKKESNENISFTYYYELYTNFEKELQIPSSVTENQSSIVNTFNNDLDDDNDLDNDNSLKLKNNVRFNVKINLISSLYELDKGDILASIEEEEDKLVEEEEDEDEDEDVEVEKGVDKKGVKRERQNGNDKDKDADKEVEVSVYNKGEKRERQNVINERSNGNDTEQTIVNQTPFKRRTLGGGAAPYELLDLSEEGKKLKKYNDVYIKTIKKYDIKDLLERGVDSYHDFGKKLKKDNTNQLNLKKELFEHFNPEKFDDVFNVEYPDPNNKKKKEEKKEKEKKFLVSLTSLIYESFNTKIIQNLKQNPYKINSNISIPFIPRITKQTSIGSDYNPFAKKGWEKNSALYYIAGNTILKNNTSTSPQISKGIRDENLFQKASATGKQIIIFQDSQGASDSIFSFFDNIEMKPGSFYQSFDNYINSLKKNQLDNFIKELNKITKDLKVNKITKKNYEKDDIKYGLYNILKREKLKTINTNIIGTNDNTWNMRNPATALDGAGSNYLVKSDFEDNLKKINFKCYKKINGINILRLEEIYDANKQTYPDNFKSPTNYNNLKIYYTGVTDTVTGTPADLISMYRLVYNNNGIKINVLDNTYDEHFKKICDNSSRTLASTSQNVPPIPNPFGLENIHDIKFEVVLGEFLVNNEEQLWPILLMSHFKLDKTKTNTISTTDLTGQNAGTHFNICATSILLDKLTEIGNLTKVMEIIYKLEDNPIDATNTLTTLVNSNKMDSNYRDIYKHLMEWRENTKDTTLPNEQMWTKDKINVVFLRILYTLKMIGDHGQVKYIKELKKIPNFNKNFEVLFTTGDSLARLYACCHNITNMSAVVTDFPSEEYCVSKPKGMVYYPST